MKQKKKRQIEKRHNRLTLNIDKSTCNRKIKYRKKIEFIIIIHVSILFVVVVVDYDDVNRVVNAYRQKQQQQRKPVCVDSHTMCVKRL
jgi:hypothetical protein